MYRFSVLLLLQLKQYHISGRFSKRIHSFFPVQTEVTLAFSKLPADWKLLFQLTLRKCPLLYLTLIVWKSYAWSCDQVHISLLSISEGNELGVSH